MTKLEFINLQIGMKKAGMVAAGTAEIYQILRAEVRYLEKILSVERERNRAYRG